MDRGHGHRTVLSGVMVGAALLLASAEGLDAQGPPPALANPAVTATPWVQASPPSATVSPSPARPLHVERQPLFATPSASPSKEDAARVMTYRRDEDPARQTVAPSNLASKPMPPRLMPPRLTPEENAAYERNLARWQALPLEDKREIRGLVTERMQEEMEKAYTNSGLNLSGDQREIFAVRYRQERRQLERDIQEKAAVERARRMPEIMDRLRHEFGPGAPSVSGASRPAPR